jgi:hypothetical protein
MVGIDGPSLHSPQCSIIPAIEAIAVTAWPDRHHSGLLGGLCGFGGVALIDRNRTGEAGAAGPGGYFGLSFGAAGAPTIATMVPVRSGRHIPAVREG